MMMMMMMMMMIIIIIIIIMQFFCHYMYDFFNFMFNVIKILFFP